MAQLLTPPFYFYVIAGKVLHPMRDSLLKKGLPLSKPDIMRFFFIGLFLALSILLIADKRTWLTPMTSAQAEDAIQNWKLWGLLRGAFTPENPEQKEALIRFMTSQHRFHIHRFGVGALLGCYLICMALLLRRDFQTARGAVFLGTGLKIAHGVFFLGMAYWGRHVSTFLFGGPEPPLIVMDENAFHYLAGILLSILCAVLFTRVTPPPALSEITAETLVLEPALVS